VKKDILTLLDLDRDDCIRLLERAAELKQRRKQGIVEHALAGRSLGLLFQKASTRTRVSFETAMIQMGGTPIFMQTEHTQIARSEPTKDTARVLSRYVDALAIRTYSQSLLEEFSRCCDIPVINALTDDYHPCQVLSDLMTVIEIKGELKSRKIAWVGDGNNVAQSWINAAAVLGFELILACPEGYEPDAGILHEAQKRSAANITVTGDPQQAVAGADVIYTDVWASMGQEEEQTQRATAFKPFQVNQALLAHAADDGIVMHCLPAHRGEEITDEVLEGPHSVVWDQAENKMHMHKAILEILILNRKE
jgi:ornithine carbamoyltransferase